ncbi:MAG: hypothetical protein K2X55_01600 [Burkholderiaceae bacterium]|nr:hypothetical protein [Burkholderiaceae bacterium]
MKQLLKKTLVLLICITMAGCTSMRVVADGRDAVDTVARDATQGLHAGETLLVHTRDGLPQEMVFVRTDGAVLVGQADSAELRIEVTSVVRIERKEADGWKTAGMVGGVVAVLTALAAAAAHSMAKDVGNAYGNMLSGKGGR